MIFTFGYGNRKNYEQLSSYIEDNNICYLIDVRRSPRAWSRLWYGQQIASFCESKGIKYINDQSLGNTSGKSNWIPPDNEQAKKSLVNVAQTVKQNNILLLCAEMDFTRCHRTEVAEKLKVLLDTSIKHLS